MISFTYFTSQTNLNSNQDHPAEFYDHYVIMIALVCLIYPRKTFSFLGFAKLLFF